MNLFWAAALTFVSAMWILYSIQILFTDKQPSELYIAGAFIYAAVKGFNEKNRQNVIRMRDLR